MNTLDDIAKRQDIKRVFSIAKPEISQLVKSFDANNMRDMQLITEAIILGAKFSRKYADDQEWLDRLTNEGDF